MTEPLDLGICETCGGKGTLPALNFAGLPMPCPNCAEQRLRDFKASGGALYPHKDKP